MGCLASTVSPEASARIVNNAIENEIKRSKTADLNTIKLLLLGTSESGKSTFVKQMKLLHMDGFSEVDYINYHYFVVSNVFLSICLLLEALDTLNIPLDVSEELESFACELKQVRIGRAGHFRNMIHDIPGFANYFPDLNSEMGKNIHALWKSRSVQKMFKDGGNFYLLDSTEYFLDKILEISDANYKITTDDILRTRVTTTGISEVSFNFKKINFRVIDVGGQKAERRKWIHCFDNVSAVLFIVAISEYDQVMLEDPHTMRIMDSINLFDSIINNAVFNVASFALFMNKRDIFIEKLKRMPITVCFPKYMGTNSYEDSSIFIKERFSDRAPINHGLYVHFTIATDTKNMQIVFNAAMDTVMNENLNSVGVS